MQNTPPIGTILGPEEKRDAIHVAIAPVIAECVLYPGQHVGLLPNGHAAPFAKGMVGIVDPYLTHSVEVGKRFFLFLYPKTVTSLRHEWTHPAFDSADSVVVVRSKQASEHWLRKFLNTVTSPGYDEVLATATDFSDCANNGESLHFGYDASGEIPPEFWDHIEIVTGQIIPAARRPTHFSCSC